MVPGQPYYTPIGPKVSTAYILVEPMSTEPPEGGTPPPSYTLHRLLPGRQPVACGSTFSVKLTRRVARLRASFYRKSVYRSNFYQQLDGQAMSQPAAACHPVQYLAADLRPA